MAKWMLGGVVEGCPYLSIPWTHFYQKYSFREKEAREKEEVGVLLISDVAVNISGFEGEQPGVIMSKVRDVNLRQDQLNNWF